MRIPRRYTRAGRDPYEGIEFVSRSSEIRNPDGTVVFSMHDVKVAKDWSQVAVDVLVQKYFRKAGVPLQDERGQPLLDAGGKPVTGAERDARQVFDRLAGCWTHWGRPTATSRHRGRVRVPRRDVLHARAPGGRPQLPPVVQHRPALRLRDRRPGPGPLVRRPGHRRGPPGGQRLRAPAAPRLLHPVDRDDLVNEGGIMDLWIREARLFKYGSGTGTNFSTLRGEGEPLSGGGRSSGPHVVPEDRRPGRRRDQVRAAPPGAPPRWSASTSTTPTSRSSSAGRRWRSTRSPPWSPAPVPCAVTSRRSWRPVSPGRSEQADTDTATNAELRRARRVGAPDRGA